MQLELLTYRDDLVQEQQEEPQEQAGQAGAGQRGVQGEGALGPDLAHEEREAQEQSREDAHQAAMRGAEPEPAAGAARGEHAGAPHRGVVGVVAVGSQGFVARWAERS